MATLTWSQLALDDLQHIAAFIREINPPREQQFLADIIRKADQVGMCLRSGQKVSSFSTGRSEVRTLLLTKGLRLLCRVTPADEVFILQVLDLRTDRPFYR